TGAPQVVMLEHEYDDLKSCRGRKCRADKCFRGFPEGFFMSRRNAIGDCRRRWLYVFEHLS
ncbi:hypothetical protein A2U01_0063310, partial [Trifolium medium]|nr:hypothetical protein [Trifolium medium]